MQTIVEQTGNQLNTELKKLMDKQFGLANTNNHKKSSSIDVELLMEFGINTPEFDMI